MVDTSGKVGFFDVSVILFFIGVWRLTNTSNSLMSIIIALELVFLSIGISLATSSYFLDDSFGQFLFLLILTVAAGESAVGLAIMVNFYRFRGSISTDVISALKGLN